MDTDIIERYNNGERGFSRENLYQAKLAGVSLSGADLHEANLCEADLSEADLSYCDLRRANLYRSNLTGANLTGADLAEANLSEADLTDTIFDGSNLCHANLYLAINPEQAKTANFDEDWQPPDELKLQRITVVDIVSVDPFLRFATVKYGNSVLNNVIVPNTIIVGNVQPGDSGLLLRTQNGLNILLHTFSISTNTDDMVSFVGGIKVGTYSNFLPSATYEISYDYEGYEIKVAEDTYAGEIRAFNSNLYSWCSSYTTTYSQYYDPYNTMYGFNPEWVKWDDARYIQGIPVVDKKPSDNDTLVFDNTIGMYRPGVVGCTLIASAVLTANATSVTFSNIPGIYTDLMLTGVARTDRASEDDNIAARFNDDSGNNYGWINPAFSGTPTGTASMTCYIGRGVERLVFARAEAASSTGGQFSGIGVIITQYSNTAVLKVTNSIASAKFGNADADADYKTGIYSGLWHSTNAITKITMFPHGGTNLVAGSRFYLWGLK